MRIIDHKKTIIVLLLITLEIGAIAYFNYQNFLNDTRVVDDKTKKLENSKNSMFAIMLEQTEGKEDYLESSTTSWPTEGYKYNSARSGCTDSNGNTLPGILTFDEETHTAIVNTNKTTYCYLYFDLEPTSPASVTLT